MFVRVDLPISSSLSVEEKGNSPNPRAIHDSFVQKIYKKKIPLHYYRQTLINGWPDIVFLALIGESRRETTRKYIVVGVLDII
jgi:hypothetical protein